MDAPRTLIARLAPRLFVPALALAVVVACGSRTPLWCERPVQAASVPPTLYFVLDHSGSMAQNGKWESVRGALAAVADQLGPQAELGITMFPPSSADECQTGEEIVSPSTGQSGDSIRDATVTRPGGGTPLAATVISLVPRLSGLLADAGVVAIVVTDGGPNCNDALTCTTERCTENIDAVDSACPQDGSNCCAAGAIAGPEGCLDDDSAVDAVTELRAAGVRTFVLGVPGSEPYASTLDRLAVAGGTARPSEPHYYQVADSSTGEFTSALAQVVRDSETSCDLRLARVINPSDAIISVGDALIAPDAVNGWTLSQDRLTLRGAACAARRAGSSVTVLVHDQCT